VSEHGKNPLYAKRLKNDDALQTLQICKDKAELWTAAGQRKRKVRRTMPERSDKICSKSIGSHPLEFCVLVCIDQAHKGLVRLDGCIPKLYSKNERMSNHESKF